MRKVYYSFFSLLVFLIYRHWFTLRPLTAGDWQYFFPHALPYYSFLPSVWNYHLIGGFGGNIAFILGLETFYLFTAKVGALLSIPWEVTEKLVWFFPFLILSLFSSYQLARQISKSDYVAVFAAFLYVTNSYVLMLVGGGQMGVAMAYALAPLVLRQFMIVIGHSVSRKETSEKNYIGLSLIAGLVTAIQVLFDLRIAYISLAAVFLYGLLQLFFRSVTLRDTKRVILYVVLIPAAVPIFLNFFWILPTVAAKQSPLEQLGSEYVSQDAVKYFSFAQLEESLSLLHPYWPENIFGKVGFMRAEFLFLPILAFSSLLFLNEKFKVKSSRLPLKNKGDEYTNSSQQVRTIVFFSLIGLIGAFLAKGANEPLGDVYLWLFDHLPGFMMFRDPLKWYTLIAISYSLLIPYSIYLIYEWLKSKQKLQITNIKLQISSKNKFLNLQNLFLFFVLSSFIFLIRPAVFGELAGTFSPQQLPQEYAQLEEYISTQPSFFRTLWIPSVQRFGYTSQQHPAIAANTLLKQYDNKKIIKSLLNDRVLLQEVGVKYVIIPYDSRGELFLNDRKYSNEEYLAARAGIEKIPWLQKITEFGKIQVFMLAGYKDHFWLEGKRQLVKYKVIRPTEYRLQLSDVQKGTTVIFSDSFDPNWVMSVDGMSIPSRKYHYYFNSFVLPNNGSYSVTISYAPQQWVDQGLVISAISLAGVLVSIAFLSRKRRKYGY